MSSFVKASGGITPNSADPGEEFPFLHTITVVDRVVSVDKPELVQNNIKTETVTLNLDSEWEGLSTVINIGNERPVSVIWSGEPVVIPAELMTTVGSLDVSVVGYGDDGGIRAVTKQAKSIFNVVASGFVEGDEAVPDPTTLLGQLIQAADNANQAADRFNQASDDIEAIEGIEGIGAAVEKVQASEANAKQSETNAAASAESASQSASTASASAEAAGTSETNAAASSATASEASTAAKASETNAASSATAALQSASQAQSSATAAASSAQAASESAQAAKTSETNAASSASAADAAIESINETADTAVEKINQTASDAVESIGKAEESINESVTAATSSEQQAAASASAAQTSERNASNSATQASQSATAAQEAADGFGLEVGTTTTGEPGTDASVSISKQGTKYVADFTIPQGPQGDPGPKGDPGDPGPKGDPGDLSAIVLNNTLTGDGTSGNPIGVAKGTLITPDKTTYDLSLDLNDVKDIGLYDVRLKSNSVNTPVSLTGGKTLVGAMLVLPAGYEASVSQVIFTRESWGVNVYLRSYDAYDDTWTAWNSAAAQYSANTLASSATALEALEVRVQALEARANQ